MPFDRERYGRFVPLTDIKHCLVGRPWAIGEHVRWWKQSSSQMSTAASPRRVDVGLAMRKVTLLHNAAPRNLSMKS